MATKFISLLALALGNASCQVRSEKVFEFEAAMCEDGACESKKGNAMLQVGQLNQARVVEHTAKEKVQAPAQQPATLTRFISASFPRAANAPSLIQKEDLPQFCFHLQEKAQAAFVDEYNETHLHPVAGILNNGDHIKAACCDGVPGDDQGTVCCNGVAPTEADPAVLCQCQETGSTMLQIPDLIVDVDLPRTDKESIAEAAQQIAHFARETQSSAVFLFQHQGALDEVGVLLENVEHNSLLRVWQRSAYYISFYGPAYLAAQRYR